MDLSERVVKKNGVAGDIKVVGKDGELVGTVEVAVDVHLFRVRAGSSMGRPKEIWHLIRSNAGSILIERLKGFDEEKESFRVTFGGKSSMLEV